MGWNITEQHTEKVEDTNPNTWMRAAEESLKHNNIKDALNKINKAVSFSGNNPNYIFEKLKVLISCHHYREAFSMYVNYHRKFQKVLPREKWNQMKSWRPILAKYLLNKIKDLYKQKKYFECESLCIKALGEYAFITKSGFLKKVNQFKIKNIMAKCSIKQGKVFYGIKLYLFRPIYILLLLVIIALYSSDFLYEVGILKATIVSAETTTNNLTVSLGKMEKMPIDIITKPKIRNVGYIYKYDSNLIGIDEDNNIIGLDVGTTNVDVIIEGKEEKKIQFEVQVVPPRISKIYTSQKELKLNVGESQKIDFRTIFDEPTVYYDYNFDIRETSSNPNVAIIGEDSDNDKRLNIAIKDRFLKEAYEQSRYIKGIGHGTTEISIKCDDAEVIIPVEVLKPNYEVEIWFSKHYYFNNNTREIANSIIKSLDDSTFTLPNRYNRSENWFDETTVIIHLDSDKDTKDYHIEQMMSGIEVLPFKPKVAIKTEKYYKFKPKTVIYVGKDYYDLLK